MNPRVRLAVCIDTQNIAYYVAQFIWQTVMPFAFYLLVLKVRSSIIAFRLMKSFAIRPYDSSELLVCKLLAACVRPDLLTECCTG